MSSAAPVATTPVPVPEPPTRTGTGSASMPDIFGGGLGVLPGPSGAGAPAAPGQPGRATTGPVTEGPNTTGPTGQGYSPYRYGTPAGPQATGPAGQAQSYVPLAPTNPILGSPESPWQPPTSGSASPVLGFGSGAAAQGITPYSLPGAAPGAAAPTRYRSFTEYAGPVAQPQGPSIGAGGGAPASKPFSGYQLPPAVSPYMNLFRSQSRFDNVDNYNTYVRPRLEQDFLNQAFTTQIQSLHGAPQAGAARGGSQIGLGAPAYFMNHGAYYPGMSRRR
jgi:hypothetical protein